MTDINDAVGSMPDQNALISPVVAIQEAIPDTDDQLKEKIVFTFKDYNLSECELTNLDKKDAKALINEFKRLNDTTLKELPARRLIRDNVCSGGNYDSLYNNLPEDVEIKEVGYGKQGRIFGYLVDRYFCIVAVKVRHVKY